MNMAYLGRKEYWISIFVKLANDNEVIYKIHIK